MTACRISFTPGEREALVPEGTDLFSAAIAAGVRLYSSCAGEGVCGRCRVIVRQGKVATEPTGRLTVEERRAGYVLACRTTVQGDAQVEVPPESRMEWEQILTEEARTNRLAGLFSQAEEVEKGIELVGREFFTYSPLSTKLFLRLPPPTLSDNLSDLERLYREIRRHRKLPLMQTGLANVRKLGRLLRESNWEVTVTLGQRNGTTEVVLIEPGDTSRRNYGVFLDIGTTTVVVSLVDLDSRAVLGTRATHNPQSGYGEDVITRIIYAEKEEGLEKLHHAVVDTINEMISALVLVNGLSLNEVTAAVCAGNMTMAHLLLRVDPAYIRRDPYVPTANFMPPIRAAEAGIKINPRGLLACLPGVSSFVGGDITAGVLASGIDEAEAPAMLIDLGTNGEIVLGNREWLVCCSASAGPAFEGSGVRCGVRAMQGAIQKVEINPRTGEVWWAAIGGARPVGICGSGYIDVLAELFKAGLIDRQGMFRPGSSPRVRQGEDGPEFVLVRAAHSATGREIVVAQTDLENLIRSKGAIYAAAKVLVEKMGMDFDEIEQIYIGGGFGNYLNIRKAIWIGLLPDLPLERFEFIGNSSLAGAKMALLSREAMAKAHEIAERMTNLELCAEPAYMREYVGALFLPHTDADLFPSVMQNLERMSPCPAG
jgi:uncharacterized 2Fe-2S/4Fe-4S cluster protein (DUF4445 family)